MNPLDSVEYELVAAIAERAKLDAKIKTLQETAKLLQPIYGKAPRAVGLASLSRLTEEEIANMGMTAAIERILFSVAGTWMPPTSVRNALVEAGFELSGDNPMAAIHQALKRLVARGNWFVSDEIDGTTQYKYDPSLHPLVQGARYRAGEQTYAAGKPVSPPPLPPAFGRKKAGMAPPGELKR
jgi:hypothetical protein